MLLHRVRCQQTRRCSYLIADSGSRTAVVVDPVEATEASLAERVNSAGLSVVWTVQTRIERLEVDSGVERHRALLANLGLVADGAPSSWNCQAFGARLGSRTIAPTGNWSDDHVNSVLVRVGESLVELGGQEAPVYTCDAINPFALTWSSARFSAGSLTCEAFPFADEPDAIVVRVGDRLFTGACSGAHRTSAALRSFRGLLIHPRFDDDEEELLVCDDTGSGGAAPRGLPVDSVTSQSRST